MTEEQEKGMIFNNIWTLYKSIEPILIKCNLKTQPDYNYLYLLSTLTHINKLRAGEEWLKRFIGDRIVPWQKVRAENKEEYWDNLDLMGWGGEFTEVKKLKVLSKDIRIDWNNVANFLVKKPKKDADEKPV